MALARLYLVAALAALGLLTVNHSFVFEIKSREGLPEEGSAAPHKPSPHHLDGLASTLEELEDRIRTAQREMEHSSFSLASAEEELVEIRRKQALTQVELASATRILSHMRSMVSRKPVGILDGRSRSKPKLSGDSLIARSKN